ncbi:Gfo/Idh/MocA family protein [Amantichitinum ursilacus]|uniref:Glucose--fructose oxidoreductase n=1 Tax=Amantichitinum ursilacus TaxID=857265 RepID=A0A0N0GNP9_9NEIS|nr:Gfo/Idh/MocA family oxidoreductase [Amantichitinum ursilacus]KPC53054.1 Glucose--fructose oxidoreductase precursor [Amantichitinum ursilacus]
MDQVRYGVVGCGWISQQYFLPGVANTGNSSVGALVSDDEAKLRQLGDRYHVPAEARYGYEQFEQMLDADVVDALYIATPNWKHLEFAVTALERGIPVLLEKPAAVSVAECQAMIEAAERGNAPLMLAYRLHFEPATLAAVAAVREGKLGDVRLFTSTFGQPVDPANHRAHSGFWAGPVADMGPYPINAARMLFGAEPIEVHATGTRRAELEFDFHDTVAVTLRFPGERLAQFVVSYAGSAGVNTYRIVGTQGDLRVEPCFDLSVDYHHYLTIDGESSHQTFMQTDHFGGETQYFSECVIQGKKPEPDGLEGLADVRIIAAIETALTTGQPQLLEPFDRGQQVDPANARHLSPVELPPLVDAATPQG